MSKPRWRIMMTATETSPNPPLTKEQIEEWLMELVCDNTTLIVERVEAVEVGQ